MPKQEMKNEPKEKVFSLWAIMSTELLMSANEKERNNSLKTVKLFRPGKTFISAAMT